MCLNIDMTKKKTSEVDTDICGAFLIGTPFMHIMVHKCPGKKENF